MVSPRIRVDGVEAMQRILEAGSANIAKALGSALTEEAMLVGRDSMREAPVRDGFLVGSFQVNPPKFSNGMVKIVMGYGGAAAAYALYQHNAPPGWRYTKAGSKSHFLSDPLTKAIPRIEANLTRRIGRVLERQGT